MFGPISPGPKRLSSAGSLFVQPQTVRDPLETKPDTVVLGCVSQDPDLGIAKPQSQTNAADLSIPEWQALDRASDWFAQNLFSRLTTNNYIKTMAEDPIDGTEKTALLREVGFEFDPTTLQPLKCPTWLDFANRYSQAMQARGVSAQDTIKPALIYTRQHGDRTDYQFVDPLREELPSQEQGWQLARPNQTVPFNLPTEDYLGAIRQGKLALFFDAHDINHLLTYLRTPAISKIQMEAVRKQDVQNLSPTLDRRNFMALEFLSYPERDRSAMSFLAQERGLTKPHSTEELMAGLATLSDAQIGQYAVALSEKLSQSLVDLGGSSFQSEEKYRYLQPLKDFPSWSAQTPQGQENLRTITENFIEPSFRFIHESQSGPSPVHPFQNQATNTVLNYNPVITAATLKALGEQLAHGQPATDEIRSMLERTVAETESLVLHANTDLPLETFLAQFMAPDLKSTTPAAQLWQELVPSPELQREFLPNDKPDH